MERWRDGCFEEVDEIGVHEAVRVGLGSWHQHDEHAPISNPTESMIEIWEDPDDPDDSYVESEADLAKYLRPLISKSEAGAFLEQLVSPFPAHRFVPLDQRLQSYQAAFDSEDFATLVDTLHRLYNTADATADDASNLNRFEDAVIDELALVLGTTPATLKTRIRQRADVQVGSPLVELPDRSAELAAHVLAPIDGWESVGAFAIEGTISIGDRPLLEARRGVWHARYTLNEFELPDAIALIHSDVSDELIDYLQRATPDEHQVFGGRGSIEIVDGALRDDDDWHRHIGDYGDLEIIIGRGLKAYMEADGDHRPGLVLANGKAILVHITNS